MSASSRTGTSTAEGQVSASDTPQEDIFTVLLVDLPERVPKMEEVGDKVAVPRQFARVRAIASALRRVDPTLLSIPFSHFTEDWLFLGKSPSALLEAALREQAVWEWLPARIALAAGRLTWLPGNSGSKDYLRGQALDLARALLQLCPRGGVVVDRDVYYAAQELPRLRRLLLRTEGKVSGFGRVSYWRVEPVFKAHA